MKKLTLLFAAVMATTMTFAGTVVYDLQGGVTNDYGWTSPSEMFDAFMAQSGATGYSTLAEYKAMADPLGGTGICGKLTNPETCFADTAKWGWLKTHVATVQAAQRAAEGDAPTVSVLPDNGAGAAWRYAVGAFFVDGQRTGWPKSADFATFGVSTLIAYQSLWGHAWANPTTIDSVWVLNAPYKEGEGFRGWYDNAAGRGTKITQIDSTYNGTLYACFGEYIPTIAEANAMTDSTKTAGTVVYVRGTSNVYIQDETAGTLLYLAQGQTTPTVGQFITVYGLPTTYKGAQELAGAKILAVEAGTLPEEQNVTLATFMAKPLDYFAERLFVVGMEITSYDSNGYPYVTDGVDTIQVFNAKPDQTVFPVGTRVNLHVIGSFYNKAQFVGDDASVVAAPLAGKDDFAYPALGENGVYTLANKWIFSNVEDNFAANMPGPLDFVRGMVAKDGKMYFINRNTASFTVIDGATGKMLAPIAITGEHLYQEADSTGNNWNNCVTLAYNDVKLDGAGHFLIGACITGKQPMQVYVVDIATGAATELINEHLTANEEWGAEAAGLRFDAFNVYGDVTGDAVVMAADANSFYAYKWEIENGVAKPATRINCTPESSDVSLLVKEDGSLAVTSFGTAPQIFPVDFNYFYVDGWSTLPTLFDMEGNIAEDFATCPTGIKVPMGTDTLVMNTGHNGICEFQIGDEYFVVMAATNVEGKNVAGTKVPSSFAIYKFADAAKSFAGLEPMWYFPHNGMGTATVGARVAVPSVEVNGTTASIYVYTLNNGYGVYTMTGKEATGIKNVNEAVKAVKMLENGQVYIIRNGVRYTVLGTEVR